MKATTFRHLRQHRRLAGRVVFHLRLIPRLGLLLAVLLVGSCAVTGTADDLVLAAKGRSDYQIVVPDQYPSPAIGECLRQTARLLQTAFKGNGVEVPVVPEGNRDPTKPAICLGDTARARAWMSRGWKTGAICSESSEWM